MFNLISIIFISLAVLIILVIIIRKFPALAVLDINNIPGEKETKFKQKIIKARIDRDLAQWGGFLGRTWLFIHKGWLSFLQGRKISLEKLKNNYQANIKRPWLEKQKRIHKLSMAIKNSVKKEDDIATEKRLVEIISLDQKNLKAFFDLANLYTEQKKLFEARQTYEYVLKLAKQADRTGSTGDILPQEIYFALAKMEKIADNLKASLENMREALDLEPSSPRYLDLILDLSIMMKDKKLAQESWLKLKEVNPENNKLTEWEEEINGL